jgi:hypothetical protein
VRGMAGAAAGTAARARARWARARRRRGHTGRGYDGVARARPAWRRDAGAVARAVGRGTVGEGAAAVRARRRCV